MPAIRIMSAVLMLHKIDSAYLSASMFIFEKQLNMWFISNNSVKLKFVQCYSLGLSKMADFLSGI